MIVHSPSSSRGPTPSDPSAPTDSFERRDGAETSAETDPFRQLFRRHANHLNTAHINRLQARLRRRMFTDDNEQ